MVKFVASSFLFFLFSFSFAQDSIDKLRLNNKAIRIVTYNVENLFDIYDDSLKDDKEYLPTSKKKWDEAKYWHKQNNIAKTIIAIGGVETPDIIGLCEIENKLVLQDLTQNSPLKTAGYIFLHKESTDKRGVDVALLYKPTSFKVLHWHVIPVKLSPTQKTRDMLYVKGIVLKKDTVHIFINHWPSRIGGELRTEPLRMQVAAILKKQIDSIYLTTKNPQIIIMGDFNDEPTNRSINETLGVTSSDTSTTSKLYNLTLPIYKRSEGSLMHKDRIGWRWSMFDQIIVSKPLYFAEKQLSINNQQATIFKAPFLLETTKDGTIQKPKRTFQGPVYKGGISDHLPVYVDVMVR